MTKTESTIRFLFGASRKDIRPLVHAVDITIKLMFSQGIPMDDIRVTHAVYPQVAKRLKTRRDGWTGPWQNMRDFITMWDLCGCTQQWQITGSQGIMHPISEVSMQPICWQEGSMCWAILSGPGMMIKPGG